MRQHGKTNKTAVKRPLVYFFGWVAEWFNATVLKTVVGETPPGVQIPPHPPGFIDFQSIPKNPAEPRDFLMH